MIPTVLDIASLPPDKLPPKVVIPPLTKPFDVVIRPPGSKSLTNRALLLAALADGASTLHGALLDAEDSQVMIRALEQLGAKIDIQQTDADIAVGNATLHVTGVSGQWKPHDHNTVLNLANAGTATRFLAAAAILSDPARGSVTIDGNARMRERPIGELVDIMWAMGVDVRDRGRPGFPPITIYPPSSLADLQPRIGVPPTQSSQFVSAVALVAALLPRGLHLLIRKPITSEPYLRMSQALLQRLGISIRVDSSNDVESMRILPLGSDARADAVDGSPESYAPVTPKTLQAFSMQIEPDVSGASYFAAAAAIVPHARMTMPCPSPSLQGDTDFFSYLARLDVRTHATESSREFVGPVSIPPIHASFSHMPDVSMTAAAIAAFASGPSTVLAGLRTLRVKETDRLTAIQNELAKLGLKVEIQSSKEDESLRITPPPGGIDCSPTAPLVEFDTYNDHRMAMSLALIGLRRPNVVIRDPACVRKTYPTFWRDLAKLYA